ncbi:hypothetical protein NEHOM01_1948 [Nematocida homosporus]|uniref:uncharacterized protein n=1 Tax=Nematocida homosporus TaxID=1912981 RepID=UPI00221FCFB7|nr:uncharacterized protein NEHOM01_1948 [Nematocida homosporus]KAI5187122.1 hypothetical protein NEHOM01_1948 [Nematocida homosporus]
MQPMGTTAQQGGSQDPLIETTIPPLLHPTTNHNKHASLSIKDWYVLCHFTIAQTIWSCFLIQFVIHCLFYLTQISEVAESHKQTFQEAVLTLQTPWKAAPALKHYLMASNVIKWAAGVIFTLVLFGQLIYQVTCYPHSSLFLYVAALYIVVIISGIHYIAYELITYATQSGIMHLYRVNAAFGAIVASFIALIGFIIMVCLFRFPRNNCPTHFKKVVNTIIVLALTIFLFITFGYLLWGHRSAFDTIQTDVKMWIGHQLEHPAPNVTFTAPNSTLNATNATSAILNSTHIPTT